MTTAAHGKELRWNDMDEATRDLFRNAARVQWDTWVQNGAVHVLSLEESKAVQQELERKGEGERILQPRFVLTDKNAAHRTPANNLPIKPSARLVVQGFRDLANLRGELRKDAPTASRTAQHMLCAIAAWHPSWSYLSADVRAAFLKGDPYLVTQLYLTNSSPEGRIWFS